MPGSRRRLRDDDAGDGGRFNRELKSSAGYQHLLDEVEELRALVERLEVLVTRMEANPMFVFGRALSSGVGLFVGVTAFLGSFTGACYAVYQLWQAVSR